MLPITEPLHVPLVIVPTLVKLDPVTVDFNVVPVTVPASAVTVISELPLKAIPLMFLEVANVVAVVALPDNAPDKFVAANELKPVTEVTVPPNVNVVDPNVVVFVAN